MKEKTTTGNNTMIEEDIIDIDEMDGWFAQD